MLKRMYFSLHANDVFYILWHYDSMMTSINRSFHNAYMQNWDIISTTGSIGVCRLLFNIYLFIWFIACVKHLLATLMSKMEDISSISCFMTCAKSMKESYLFIAFLNRADQSSFYLSWLTLPCSQSKQGHLPPCVENCKVIHASEKHLKRDKGGIIQPVSGAADVEISTLHCSANCEREMPREKTTTMYGTWHCEVHTSLAFQSNSGKPGEHEQPKYKEWIIVILLGE